MVTLGVEKKSKKIYYIIACFTCLQFNVTLLYICVWVCAHTHMYVCIYI
jgi:hypothetical protein